MKLFSLAPAVALGAALIAYGAPASAQQYNHHRGYTHTTVTRSYHSGYRYGGTYNGYRPGYYGNGWTYSGNYHYWHHHRAYWRNGAWGYYGPSGLWISIPL
ncbi:MAG TPA: hypothetical protein VMD91_11075 [Candidatus Sulfotelmatobacter sp.]|nr:hypothetical protein [Candidatus Sulfotelmatobacter sp.]